MRALLKFGCLLAFGAEFCSNKRDLVSEQLRSAGGLSVATLVIGNLSVNVSRRRKPKPNNRPKPVSLPGSVMAFYQALLHVGDGNQGADHIYRQWRDAFVESGVPFITLFRHHRIFERARKEFPSDAMIFASGAEEATNELAKLTGVTAYYYTGNTGNNVHLWANGDVKHIFIGHGDSDKSTSATRVFRTYDEVWVAGKGHIDRLQHIPHSWVFRIVGRPQVLPLLQEKAPDASVQTFCYLPTWEGAGASPAVSSLSIATEVMGALSSRGAALAKFHPATGVRISEYQSLEAKCNELGFSVLERARPITNVMAEAHFCVTDISSVISDWLVTKRPVFVYVPEHMRNDSERLPILRYAYAYSSIEELERHLDRVLRGFDPLSDARETASEYLVSSNATRSGEFIRAVRENAGSSGPSLVSLTGSLSTGENPVGGSAN